MFIKLFNRTISVYFAVFLLAGGLQSAINIPLCKSFVDNEEKCAMSCCEVSCCSDDINGASLSVPKKCCEVKQGAPDSEKYLITTAPANLEKVAVRTVEFQLSEINSPSNNSFNDPQKYRRGTSIIELHILRI